VFIGLLFVSLAVVGFGLASVFARLGLQRLPPTIGTLVSVATSFLFTSILVLMLYPTDVMLLAPMAFLWFFFYGLITFPLARLFYYSAINLAGAARATPVMAISPVFATIIAIIALGERPNLLISTGILVTVIGMALILGDRRSSAS